MNARLLILLSAFLLVFMPKASFAQAPDLGVTSSFALFTAVGSFDNTGATVITGDAGTNVGAFTGFPIPGTINGTTHVVDPVSVQAAIDVDVAYSFLFAKTCGPVLGTTLGNNQVLTPNVYCLGGASSLNGDLILDGQGNPNAIFIFKIDGALSTSTFANVILINSASMCNVYWQINGKFELGENSVFRGTVIANGDISLLEGAALYGRGLSREGAISLHNNIVNAAMQPNVSTITAGGATTICGGGSVVLSGNANGIWNNGSTNASITVTTSGDYYVTNSNACGSATSNHINVKISPAVVASVITANKATTFCEGGIVILSGNVGGTWSNGATTASTTVTTSGDYFVTNTNACGTLTSNHIAVTVNPKPTASVISAGGVSTTICNGENVVLSGNVGGTWSNGAITATISVSAAGDYYVTNTNACANVTSNHIVVTVNAPVVASVLSAGSATTFCAGGNVILSGNVGGKWNNNATTATITVTTSGDYYVTNTNACGTIISNHIVVTVNPLPVASTITSGGTTTFCEGQSVVLSGNVGGVWSNGATTASTTVTASGDYYVTNTTTCGTITSNHIIVTTNPQLTAAIISAESATTFCAGGSVILSGNNGGIWNNGATTATITVNAEGDYFVTKANACGTVTSNHIAVNVNPLPLAVTGRNTSICLGNNVTLGSSSVAGHTYLWTPSTGLSSTTISNPVANPTVTTTYTLTETISATGCDASHSVTVTISAAPSISTSSCVGGSVSFSATATGTDVTYQWRNGNVNLMDGGNISGATSSTLTISPVSLADASANYNVVVTGACSASVTPLSIALLVFNAPIIVTEPVNQAPCEGTAVSYTVAANGIGLVYQWRKGTVNLTNGGNISGATSATLTINPVTAFDVASDYNVVITGACSNVAVTSANASLALCVATPFAQVQASMSNQAVSIYPNPSTNLINIDIVDASQVKNAELKLYDGTGAVIINTPLTNKTTSIKTNNFPSGIYMYKIIEKDQTIQSGKLIFQQ